MAELVLAGLVLAYPLIPSLDLPEKLPPHARISLAPADSLKRWTTLYTITTVSKGRYEVRIDYGPKADFEMDTLRYLLEANWCADWELGSSSVRIYGVRAPAGEIDQVESLSILNRAVEGKGAMPDLTSAGGVKVERKDENGKTQPVLIGKTLPHGPDIRNEAYVEFDLSTFPIGLPKVRWDLGFYVFAPPSSDHSSPNVMFFLTVDASKPLDCAPEVMESLWRSGCKAELIGQTKLRVYGQVLGGRYYPALRGAVESEDLPPDKLPKVKNAGS